MIMKKGFYWIKKTSTSNWEVAALVSPEIDYWLRFSTDKNFTATDFAVIGPKIEEPKE